MTQARLLRRAALVALLLLLISTPVLGQSSGDPEHEEGTTEDAFNMQAGYYAELADISIDDAKRRMEAQEDASTLNWMLERYAGDVLGGFSIEDHPYFHVKVTVIAGGEDRVRPYIDESPLRDIVEVEIAERTLEDLRREHEHVIALLAPINLVYQSEIWGQREVRITVEDLKSFQQQLRDADIELPATVVLIEDPDGIFRPDASVIGGWQFNTCTSGFTGYHLASGTKGVLTAGHCNGLNAGPAEFIGVTSLAGAWFGFTHIHEHVGGSRDFQLNLENPNHTLRSMITTNSTWHPITGLKWRNSQDPSANMPIGTFVCKQGRNTGYKCGWIRGHNVRPPEYHGRTFTDTFIRVNNVNNDTPKPVADNGTVIAASGDSGGPWHGAVGSTVNSAYGLHFGNAGGIAASFMAQDYLYAAGYRIFLNCSTKNGLTYNCSD